MKYRLDRIFGTLIVLSISFQFLTMSALGYVVPVQNQSAAPFQVASLEDPSLNLMQEGIPPELVERYRLDEEGSVQLEYIPPSPEVIARTQDQINNFSCTTVTDVPQIECEALVALYNSTNGAGWKENANWLTGTEVYYWDGVEVLSNHISRLFLEFNQLNGKIPSEIGNLSYLQDLYLYSNQLTGNIPLQIGQLINLKTLEIDRNFLSGGIPPQLGNLTNLEWLLLQSNQLSGSIPFEFGNMSSLKGLVLSSNQLTGEIPPELGNLSTLQDLQLSSNQLSGSIPVELLVETNLHTLSLYGNQLTGGIPSQLGNHTNLEYLSLAHNRLSGSIPSTLSNLNNLQSLYLDYNRLSGLIPIEMSDIVSLHNLHLSNNKLTGDIPESLSYLENLCTPNDTVYPCWGNYGFQVSFNGLNTSGYSQMLFDFLDINDPDWAETQVIPFTSCTQIADVPENECEALVNFYNSTNGIEWITERNWLLSNTIDDWYGIIVMDGNVSYIYLSQNQIIGNIPSEFGNLNYLKSLNLDGNLLSGSIPPQLGNLTLLLGLDLSDNKLSGNVPDGLTQLVNLCDPGNINYPCNGIYMLDLGYNQLNVPAPEPQASFLDIKDPDWYLTQAVEEEIPGDTGGTVVSNDANTEIVIPAGAFEGTVTFLFAPQPNPGHLTGNLESTGKSFELTAMLVETLVTSFDPPLTLTFHYDQDLLGPIPEDTLALYYWDNSLLEWVDAITTCPGAEYARNQVENWLSLPLCHMSEFALMGEPIRVYLPLINR